MTTPSPAQRNASYPTTLEDEWKEDGWDTDEDDLHELPVSSHHPAARGSHAVTDTHCYRGSPGHPPPRSLKSWMATAFQALIVALMLGAALLTWWQTSMAGRMGEAALTQDLAMPFTQEPGMKSVRKEPEEGHAAASGGEAVQATAAGLKRMKGRNPDRMGTSRSSRLRTRGRRSRPVEEGALPASGWDDDGSMMEVEADEESLDEELDKDGIGGGGVGTESRPAVFGASNHADDLRQPAWARVGLTGPYQGERSAQVEDEGSGAAHIAKEQQHMWSEDER